MGTPPLYLVSVGPSPSSEDLVRSAAQIALRDGARWVAVHVEALGPARRDGRAIGSLERNLAAAELLGAEVVVLKGNSVARVLSDYAQACGAVKIILGRNRDRGWRRILGRPVGTELAGLSGGWDLTIVDSQPLDTREEPELGLRPHWGPKDWSVSVVVPALSFVLAWVLRDAGASQSVQVLCFVAGVVISAGGFGLGAGVVSSVLAVLAFNFGFTQPLYTFWIDDPWNLVVFLILLLVGCGVGLLTDHLAAQARVVRNRERRLAALYRLGRELSQAESRERVDEVAEPFLRAAHGVLRVSMETLVFTTKDRLDRAREAQAGLFLQGLSHDLRTPLAVLGATARSVGESARERLTEGERGQLEAVERESVALSRQLDTLLDLTRLQEGPLGRFERLPAEEVLFSTRDAVALALTPREVTVTAPHVLSLIWGEPVLLERALVNLVENAHRYSPAGQPIELSVRPDEADVEFLVLDRGPGVADEEKDRVFEKFYRGEASRRTAGIRGTGLGLAFVREIARVHGGACGVRDRVGGGAEFWLRLPLADQDAGGNP